MYIALVGLCSRCVYTIVLRLRCIVPPFPPPSVVVQECYDCIKSHLSLLHLVLLLWLSRSAMTSWLASW